MNQIFHSF